ncbi:MAG TPA: Slp family lipoprotein [Nitrospiraceae bacterium]|nr:Slp family lipoprotein [Nitrospiraceae bacterium]
MHSLSILWACSLSLLVMSVSCTSQDYVIPEPLASHVDRSLTFEQLKESATSYIGKVVVLGGEVLNAKRLPAGTSIEILQLPLDGSEPVADVQQSQGRFLALQREFLDPATLVERPRVTIVGEVTGVQTQRLDDIEYTYPVLAVKDLKVWPDSIGSGFRPGPRFGVSIGGGTGVGIGVGGGVGIGF